MVCRFNIICTSRNRIWIFHPKPKTYITPKLISFILSFQPKKDRFLTLLGWRNPIFISYFFISPPKKPKQPNLCQSPKPKTRTNISHISPLKKKHQKTTKFSKTMPPQTPHPTRKYKKHSTKNNTKKSLFGAPPFLGPMRTNLQALVFDLPDELQVNTQLPQLGVCVFSRGFWRNQNGWEEETKTLA